MATLLRQLALVSESSSVPLADMAKVSAALQKQATRDFSPIWEVSATVDPFDKLEDVPLGYWPMIIQDDIGFDAAGIHLDKDNQPFALITAGTTWSLTASHEMLEMLADPFGNRVVAGDSPKPDQGRVEFLVEVCDPSEAKDFGYSVNNILVSDFYTPNFFDPVKAAGVRYSFTGAITEPRDVLKGGYLSWHDLTSDHWWQEIFFNGPRTFRDIGVLNNTTQSLRAQIDRITSKDSLKEIQASLASNDVHAALAARQAVAYSTAAKANVWRAQIAEILGATRQNARGAGRAGAVAEPRATRRRPPSKG